MTGRTAIAWLLAATAVAATACALRPALPPVALPLTLTPDAEFRRSPPEPWEEEPALGRLRVESFVLENGLSVRIVERRSVPLVSLRYVNRAADYSRAAPVGLASLTARAMLEGTLDADGAVLEGIRIGGIKPWARVGPAGTQIGLSIVRSGARVALETLADIIQRPAFDTAAITKATADIANEVYDGDASLFGRANALTAQVALGQGHPAAVQPGAYLKLLTSYDAATVRGFHAGEYRPEDSALVVVGDVTVEEMRPVIERAFGSWRADDSAARVAGTVRGFSLRDVGAAAIEGGRRRIYALLAGGDQAAIFFPQPAVGVRHRDHLPLRLLANIIAGGFGSRAVLALRHGSGLTYGVSAELVGSGSDTYIQILSAVEQMQVDTGIQKLGEVLESLQTELVSEEELEAARIAYIGGVDVSTNDSVAGLVARLFEDRRQPSDLADLEARVRAIRPEDIRRVAKAYLRPEGHVVVLGNYYENGEALAKLGKIVPFAAVP